MMQFQTGEIVGFIREKGTGKILKDLGKGRYLVAHPSGMDLPIDAIDLVKLRDIANPAQHAQAQAMPKLQQGIYLEAQKHSPHTNTLVPFDFSIASGYDAPVYLHLQWFDGNLWRLWWQGPLKGSERQRLATLRPEQFSALKQLNLTYLWQPDGEASQAYQALIKWPAKWFTQAHEWAENKDGLPTASRLLHPLPMPEVKAPKEQNIFRKSTLVSKPSFLLQPDADGKAEIDLHIEELLENFNHMSNHEMLEFQLNHAIRCVEEAAQRSIKKLVFIHGVGKGSLKAALLDKLKAYSFLELYDAPMQQYGLGATVARLKL